MSAIIKLGLSADQKIFRKRVIGGSDANIIMGGHEDRILRLWQEKRGEVDAEDLSDVLPVQMGSFTEPLNCHWFEKTTGRKVTHRGDERLSIDWPFMACTLDGLTDDGTTIFEAKHVSAFAKEDEIITRYLPQLTHNMLVCEVDKAVLSVFYGTMKYAHYGFDLDAIYSGALIDTERHFWHCVETGEAPVASAVPAPKPEAVRSVNMTGNNEWASSAVDWLKNAGPAKKFIAAEKSIKALAPDDAKEAFGNGITISRNKAGSLSIKPKKD